MPLNQKAQNFKKKNYVFVLMISVTVFPDGHLEWSLLAGLPAERVRLHQCIICPSDPCPKPKCHRINLLDFPNGLVIAIVFVFSLS